MATISDSIHHTGPPLIPERRISLTGPKDRERKRRSLPPSTPHHTSNDPQRRFSNRVAVKPASPEVISSLIDTLSAISAPVEHHFDNSLPNITESHSSPTSPSAWDSHFPKSDNSLRIPPSPLANGFNVSKDSLATSIAQSHSSRQHPTLTINPPPRRASRGAPEKPVKDKAREAAYEELLDDAYSIGTPSIERGKTLEPSPKQSKHRRSIKSLRSARSGRSLRSLAMKNSTESMRKSDVPLFVAKRDDETRRERLYITDPQASSGAKDLELGERNESVDAFDLLTANAVRPAKNLSTPPRLWINGDGSPSTGASHSRKSSLNTPQSDLIPTRTSSKRHSTSLHNRKRKSKASSEPGAAHDSGTEAGDDDFHTPPQSPPATITEFDEDSVNRRIEELREQKAQRERLSLEQASESLTIPESKSRSRSPSPSPLTKTLTPDPEPPNEPESKMPNGPVDASEPPEEKRDSADDTAPSPAVHVAPPKTDKATESVISALKPRPAKVAPITSNDGARSMSLPQRSNSKLFKRAPRPMSPNGGDKHRRRFSLNMSPTPQPAPPAAQESSGDSVHDAVEDYLSSPRFSQQVANPQTGRVVCFSEVGDPDGSVVFCCVGMGLTRYISTLYDELASTLKLRLITPDRPGVGGSEAHADENDTPLLWPDDVRTICEHRRITKFSILAHSAGAIYALATALRMPQHIRCRVHLLAPWIPPSQLSAIGTQEEPLPSTSMPYSQRFLRSLPATFFRAANSNFLGVTTNSLTTSLPRTPKKSKQKKTAARSNTPTPGEALNESKDTNDSPTTKQKPFNTASPAALDQENYSPLSKSATSPAILDTSSDPAAQPRKLSTTSTSAANTPTTSDPLTDKPTHRLSYENRLASRIWDLATTNANPAIDLLVCLERRQQIGFRYVDITRPVVIHHGSKDNRVPVENVRWLGKGMRRCEVRVLEGEGHGLMASAKVMGAVLMEMAGEWEDWNRIVGQGGAAKG